MGSESIVYEAEGRVGYWLRGHEGERNDCFSKIQLVGQKYREKTTLASKTRFAKTSWILLNVNSPLVAKSAGFENQNNNVLLAKVVLSPYFWPTSWILLK